MTTPSFGLMANRFPVPFPRRSKLLLPTGTVESLIRPGVGERDVVPISDGPREFFRSMEVMPL
jgi:hypothetical protein